MALDNFKNFAKVTVSTGYDDAATSVILAASEGTKLPTVSFNAVWYNASDYFDPTDDPNREIVRVTNISTDTLTVTRAQEGTSAATHNTAGKTYKMIVGLTAKTLNTDLAATYQPLDADLTTIAGLTATTDNFIVSVSSAWASRTPTQVRTTLGLVIGTNVQAYDADLTTWAGITPGTGVGTALAVNVGSAGAFVVNGGALGTPSSGTGTNITGVPAGDLAGTTLASNVVTSSLTTLGTLTSLTINSATVTLSQDTNFVTSGGVNGFSIDGTTFSVDGTNNRVGIGTAAPATLLHLNQTGGSTIRLGSGDTLTDFSDFQFYGNITASTASIGIFRAFNTQSGSGVEVGRIGFAHPGASADNKAYLQFWTHDGTSNLERVRVTEIGNMKVGTLQGSVNRATTEGTNHLDIFDGTAPAGTLTNGISLYSASGQLRAMDSAGVSTLLTTGITGLGTGIATFLATPSSANLAAAVTGETGTGALVFATSATMQTNFTVRTATDDNFYIRGKFSLPDGIVFQAINDGLSADRGLELRANNIAFMPSINVKINGTAARATTEGSGHLDIFNGTAPVGTLTNGISIYSSAGEGYMMDAAGNATLQTPHDHITNEWIYYSKNTKTGKVLEIKLERMMRKLDEMLGGGFVTEFTEDPKVSSREEFLKALHGE